MPAQLIQRQRFVKSANCHVDAIGGTSQSIGCFRRSLVANRPPQHGAIVRQFADDARPGDPFCRIQIVSPAVLLASQQHISRRKAVDGGQETDRARS